MEIIVIVFLHHMKKIIESPNAPLITVVTPPVKSAHGQFWAYICDSTYRKVPVVGRLDFELWGCKVKISQNKVPKTILKFHILWDLQYLILKSLEGFGAKTVFSCQN